MNCFFGVNGSFGDILRRTIAWGTLGVYVCVFVLLPILHRHEASDNNAPTPTCCSHCKTSDDADQSRADHGDDCSICRVLHQSVSISVPCLLNVVHDLDPTESPKPETNFLSSLKIGIAHSRAPPSC